MVNVVIRLTSGLYDRERSSDVVGNNWNRGSRKGVFENYFPSHFTLNICPVV